MGKKAVIQKKKWPLIQAFRPIKGHFCSLLISNIFCDPLFLLSAPHCSDEHATTLFLNSQGRIAFCRFHVLFEGRWVTVHGLLADWRGPFTLCRPHCRFSSHPGRCVDFRFSWAIGLFVHWCVPPLFFAFSIAYFQGQCNRQFVRNKQQKII